MRLELNPFFFMSRIAICLLNMKLFGVFYEITAQSLPTRYASLTVVIIRFFAGMTTMTSFFVEYLCFRFPLMVERIFPYRDWLVLSTSLSRLTG